MTLRLTTRWLAVAAAVTLSACAPNAASRDGTTSITPAAITIVATSPTTVPANSSIALAPHPATTTATTTATTPGPPPRPTAAAGPAPSDDVLAGQRVLCTFTGAHVPDEVVNRVQRGQAAGVVLFKANVPSLDEATTNASAVQAAAMSSPVAAPAIIAADQEGGEVKRLPGPPTVSARALGAMTAAAVRQQGRATAEGMRTWSVNTDFAPVADVARSGTFLDRQQRSFGPEAARVATDIDAFVSGLHDGGARSVAKHFPGLGAADADTDEKPATVALDGATLRAVDLAPFRAAIKAGTDAVMVSSAIYKALTDRPAVLSAGVVSGLLRGELGFTGVVVSDALDTPSLAQFGSLGEVAVQAAAAGVDLLIAARASACIEIHDALAAALGDGRLDRSAAVEAYHRVLTLRHTAGR